MVRIYIVYPNGVPAIKVKVAKWGNSLGLRLPKAAVEAAGIASGSEFDVIVDGRSIHLQPTAKSSRELLDEMVAEARRLGPEYEPETVDWGPDRGSEIIDDAYSRGEITLDDIVSGRDASRRR